MAYPTFITTPTTLLHHPTIKNPSLTKPYPSYLLPLRKKMCNFSSTTQTMCLPQKTTTPPKSPTTIIPADTKKRSSSRINEIVKTIKSGPIFEKAGHHRNFDMNDWLDLGGILEEKLIAETGHIDDERVYQYYLPVYFWLEKMVLCEKRRRVEEKSEDEDGAVIVGLSCPQGGGKTTLTRYLKDMFVIRGLECVVASLDDFYYGYEDQVRVSAENRGNELLEFRGMPGTHDVGLLKDTLECLRRGGSCYVPRYDKAAYGGRGDLKEVNDWKEVKCLDTDVVLFEGWCLGFEDVPEKMVKEFGDWRLEKVNEFLKEYKFLKDLLSAMVVIEVDDVNWVYKWREQAETARRTNGGGALSEKELQDFVSRFMPSYQLYLPYLYDHAYIPGRELRLRIDEKRKPLSLV